MTRFIKYVLVHVMRRYVENTFPGDVLENNFIMFSIIKFDYVCLAATRRVGGDQTHTKMNFTSRDASQEEASKL